MDHLKNKKLWRDGCASARGRQQRSCSDCVCVVPDNFSQLHVIVLSLNTLQVVYEASIGRQRKKDSHAWPWDLYGSVLPLDQKKRSEQTVFHAFTKAKQASSDVAKTDVCFLAFVHKMCVQQRQVIDLTKVPRLNRVYFNTGMPDTGWELHVDPVQDMQRVSI